MVTCALLRPASRPALVTSAPGAQEGPPSDVKLTLTHTRTPDWATQLSHRLRYRVVLKFVGISAFMWVFFSAYFYLLRHPGGQVTSMPLTALDHWVPFQSNAIAAYVSLWVYVGIPPGLMLRTRDALTYGAWAAALCAAGLLMFLLWPTAVPTEWRSVGVEGHAGFALLRGIDASGNAFPSLHVATATFSAFWIQRMLRIVGAPRTLSAMNGLWLLLIVHSTIATRQHVVLDAVGGVLLALPFAWASMRWWRPGPR